MRAIARAVSLKSSGAAGGLLFQRAWRECERRFAASRRGRPDRRKTRWGQLDYKRPQEMGFFSDRVGPQRRRHFVRRLPDRPWHIGG